MSTAIPIIALHDLIELHAGISLVKRANHYQYGPEYWGPCPWCGGTDRFHVWPDPPPGKRMHYWCRGCGREGSPAWFLCEYKGYSYGEALTELGIEEDQNELAEKVIRPIDPGSSPCKEWIETAEFMVERAIRYLWHPASVEGKRALEYLHERGLTDETIKLAKLGYVPLGKDGRWFVSPFYDWGIDPESLTEEQRAKGGIRIPNGILIPWFVDGKPWKLAIKRPGEEMDYGQVMGSADALYGIDAVQYGQPVVMVEGEFDALSVKQEAGDLTSVVATGSAKKGRKPRWQGDLAALASIVLQCFDADLAGQEGAEYWLKVLPKKAFRWEPWADKEQERFKDPNDMLRYAIEFKAFSGQTLRGWIEEGLKAAQWELFDQQNQPALPEPCIPHPQDIREGKAAQHPLAREGPVERAICPQCGEPASHTSPSGHAYCDKHYQCINGHAPRWKQDKGGMWLCACLWDHGYEKTIPTKLSRPVPSPDQPYSFEEVAIMHILKRHYTMQLTRTACSRCFCRLQYYSLGEWKCAGCHPGGLWTDDQIEHVRQARFLTSPPMENYWSRLKARAERPVKLTLRPPHPYRKLRSG